MRPVPSSTNWKSSGEINPEITLLHLKDVGSGKDVTPEIGDEVGGDEVGSSLPGVGGSGVTTTDAMPVAERGAEGVDKAAGAVRPPQAIKKITNKRRNRFILVLLLITEIDSFLYKREAIR
jgi:hypothetical protein